MRSPACIAALVLALALALGACGSDDEGTGGSRDTSAKAPATATPDKRTTSATTERAPAAPATCERVRAPKRREPEPVSKPKGKLDPAKTYVARVSTSCGEFAITLDVKRAPRTAASFASLAKRGFYDGLGFHRISPGFVVQGGDPQGDGSGGPGYSVTERPPTDLRYTRGTVAMAKTETEPPGTSGSQFFIVTAPSASDPPFSLPADYAVVGRVTEGLDVVQRIGELEADPETEKPLDPVVIRRVRIRRG